MDSIQPNDVRKEEPVVSAVEPVIANEYVGGQVDSGSRRSHVKQSPPRVQVRSFFFCVTFVSVDHVKLHGGAALLRDFEFVKVVLVIVQRCELCFPLRVARLRWCLKGLLQRSCLAIPNWAFKIPR